MLSFILVWTYTDTSPVSLPYPSLIPPYIYEEIATLNKPWISRRPYSFTFILIVVKQSEAYKIPFSFKN
jgi:hypothetical protein